MTRYIVFDVETPNRYNNRMSAIGISVVEDGHIVDQVLEYARKRDIANGDALVKLTVCLFVR